MGRLDKSSGEKERNEGNGESGSGRKRGSAGDAMLSDVLSWVNGSDVSVWQVVRRMFGEYNVTWWHPGPDCRSTSVPRSYPLSLSSTWNHGCEPLPCS